MVDSAYFVKSTPPRAFTGSFHCRYVTDILKMCMKKLDAEKIFFDKLRGFLVMCDSVYFVKSTPFRAFTGSYQHFEDMLQIY